MATREEMINKVKKILAKTRPGAGATVEEAATAAVMAQKLIAKYKIEAALLEEKEVESGTRERRPDEPLGKWEIYKFRGVRVTNWRLTLAGQVARANGCVHFYQTGGYKGQATIWVVGTLADSETVKLMLTLIMDEIERLYYKERPKISDKGVANSWGQSYRNGAVNTVTKRLYEAQETARKEMRGELEGTNNAHALVLFDQAFATVAQSLTRSNTWMRENMSVRYAARSNTIGQYDAYRAGQAAGTRVDLNGHKRKRLGGGGQ